LFAFRPPCGWFLLPYNSAQPNHGFAAAPCPAVGWIAVHLAFQSDKQISAASRPPQWQLFGTGGQWHQTVTTMSQVYPVILFYKFTPVADPDGLRDSQRGLCQELGLKGRILIADEGINGTLAGEATAIDHYIAALRSDPRFADIEMKTSPGDERTFPKLVVKSRPEIVTLNYPEPLGSEQHNRLTPAQWKRRMEEDGEAVLVDVRNRYEYEAGRFEGAVKCDIAHFRDLPAYLEKLEDYKDKTVMMYCTGGIRCEKASALFRRHGFQYVVQLHGGIMSYQKEFGNDHWQGECFVFDQRMTVRESEGFVPVGRCAHSGRESCRFVNCHYTPCHQLFILAESAEREDPDFRYCPECLAAGRPSRQPAKQPCE